MTGAKWRDQFVAGRVFEMKSSSTKRPAPCILIVNPNAQWRDIAAVQIDPDLGVCHGGWAGVPKARRVFVHNWRRADMSSAKISRRRRDLERFDARDMAVIAQGRPLQFGGRIPMQICSSMLPLIEGCIWTVYWTDTCDFYVRLRSQGEIEKLLKGAYFVETSSRPDRYHRPIDFRFFSWATCHRDASRLREIEQRLIAVHGCVTKSVVSIETCIENSVKVVFAHGNPGPGFTTDHVHLTYPNGFEGFEIRRGGYPRRWSND